MARLDAFIEDWGRKYPSIEKAIKDQDIENYFAYLNFPSTIHRMVYTTNWIKRLNKEIRRTTKIRNSFPNPDSAMNLICACLMNFEQKTYKYPVTAFCKIKDILDAKLDML
ncbi:transposase, Mutator family protein [Francisella philomiragia]|uniref:Mutator family transposase n=2 Tax=Francisella philomiragia TaxID=28110 RepID=B0TXE1_FRAP2|nr:transposase, Mutator family protein [Francisella philomiragia]AJI48585.1 transposase, Mutator family protein [Francisella philomiragia]